MANQFCKYNKNIKCRIVLIDFTSFDRYQYPPIYKNEISIVICPLISLMIDQVENLKDKGINACIFGSAEPRLEVYEKALAGYYSLIYMSPEFLLKGFGLQLLKKIENQICLLAVDEAHCIGFWGDDFRKEYGQLGYLRQSLKNIPIMAVTATATKRISAMICTSLRLSEPLVIKDSFNRPNLYLGVMRKSECLLVDLLPKLEDPTFATIIYVMTRKLADYISAELVTKNIKADRYHAGMTLEERNVVRRKFMFDQISVVVATIAFGK